MAAAFGVLPDPPGAIPGVVDALPGRVGVSLGSVGSLFGMDSEKHLNFFYYADKKQDDLYLQIFLPLFQQ